MRVASPKRSFQDKREAGLLVDMLILLEAERVDITKDSRSDSTNSDGRARPLISELALNKLVSGVRSDAEQIFRLGWALTHLSEWLNSMSVSVRAKVSCVSTRLFWPGQAVFSIAALPQ